MTDLQVSVEARDGLERRMRVQVPAARVDSEVEQRLRKVGRTARLKGFRPGKIPAKVLRQQYGGQVRQEVVQEVVQSTYSEAIDREQLRPAGGPRIEPETIEEGSDLSYVATFEIYPDFAVSGTSALKIDEPLVEIQDADVDEMLDKLRVQRAEWVAVERKSVEGDQVTVDFHGTLKGEPMEGGHGHDVPIVLGSGQMLPDFDKNLAGLAAGDETSFKLKFPKDYHAEDLAGQKAEFTVKVKEVAEQKLPEMDAEFIRQFGVESGELDDFRADVRSNMERELESRTRSEVRRQVIEQLLAANPIDVPAVLVEEACQDMQKDAMRNMGISDPAQAPEPGVFKESATDRVRLGLLMSTLIRDEKIELDRDRVGAKIDEIAAPYDQPEELKKMYVQNPQLLNSVENVVIEEQLIEWLIAQAAVKPKKMGFSELMKL